MSWGRHCLHLPFQPMRRISGPAPVEAAAPTHKLVISGNVDLTTDYVFRGQSQTDQNPAIQGEMDLTYNMFYVGFWASSLNFGTARQGTRRSSRTSPISRSTGTAVSGRRGRGSPSISVTSTTAIRTLELGPRPYNEIKTGVSRSFFDSHLAVSLTNYWWTTTLVRLAPMMSRIRRRLDLQKGVVLHPTISGVYGHQWADENQGGVSYDYWNAGLTLAFWDKPAMTVDVRYWDTDRRFAEHRFLLVRQRVVGTLRPLSNHFPKHISQLKRAPFRRLFLL